MRILALSCLIVALYGATAMAIPRVVVFPFEPLMNETYDFWGKQTDALDYQLAFQSFIVSDLSHNPDLEVTKFDDFVKSDSAAIAVARSMKADFAVIGSIAELPASFRADARVLDVALGSMPRGYVASATATRWEDVSGAAAEVSRQILELLSASATVRNEPRGRLVLEGDRIALGYESAELAHLIVEVNSPAPKVLVSGATMKRCSVRDRSLADGTQPGQACYSGDIPAGSASVKIEQRGYLGYEEELNLQAGKVYRFIVELEPLNFRGAPGR